MVNSILHPLASTSIKDAGKLVKHLQEVFQIKDSPDLSLLNNDNYKCVELKVDVVKAKKLRSMDANGFSDPYCTLIIINSDRIDEHGDIKNNRRKLSSEIAKTSVKNKTLEPVWNEQFKLEIKDVFTDQLLVCIWDRDEEEQKSFFENVRSVERPSGLISLCRQVKNNIGHRKFEDDFIGVVAIPVKDIPPEGCDSWWDVTTRLKKNSKFAGSINLRLNLKQNYERYDSDLYSLEDYFKIMRDLIKYSVSQQNEENIYFNGALLPESEKAFELFTKQQQIPSLTEKLIRLLAILDWNSEYKSTRIFDDAILKAFDDLDASMLSRSSWELVNDDNFQTLIFNPRELTLLDRIASAYVKSYCQDEKQLTCCLFPLDSPSFLCLTAKLKILERLSSLDTGHEAMEFRKVLVNQLEMRLQKDVHKWIDNNMKTFNDGGRDTVLQDMTDLTMLLVNITKHCSYNQLISELPFTKWGFGYQKHLAVSIDEKLHNICRDIMRQMDHYQNRYKDYHVNIKDSSALCHTYYITLKKLVQTLTRNITSDQQTDCQPPKLQLSDFHNWFNNSFLHLLQTFRSECYLRTTRAVELDTRSTLMSEEGGGHFSNSSVYVLSCFAEILTEWRQLGLEHKELHFAFLIKLTDVICDATKLYSEMMEQKASTYCKNTTGQFIVPMQVCTSINNIDHVWDYVKVLPNKMTWEEIESDDDIKTQTLDVLYKLLNSTERQVADIKEKILNSVLDYIYISAKKEIQNWTKVFNQSKDENKLIAYIDKNLCIIYQNTRNNICSIILPKLWNFVLTETANGFQDGMKPEYAKVITKNLNAVREYLISLDMEESSSKNKYEELTRYLKLNSSSSIELQLDYYHELACKVKTPLEYMGHLAFRAGYKDITKGTINIIVKILSAQNLPKQDYSGLCDPFVVIELCPQAMFPGFKMQRTRIIYQTLDPVWDENFVFANLPSSILTIKGAVLHFRVMDKDTVTSEFTGEFFVRLETLPDMSRLTSIDFLPVQMIPLKNYTNDQNTFRIIEKRSSWDKHSKLFMQTRVKFLREDTQKKATCCIFP